MNYKSSRFNMVIERNEMNALLFNTLSGSVIRLDQPLYEKLNNNLTEEITNEDLENLNKEGFIVPAEIDEFY